MENKLPTSIQYGNILKTRLGIWCLTYFDYFKKRDIFDDFLSQQPNIGMFVPAVFEDGDWKILEAPNRSTHTNEECDQYQTVLNNVIFEGFEYDGSEEGFIYVKNDETLLIFDTENKTLMLFNNMLTDNINKIEQLTHYKLTLTPKIAKELGL